MSEEEIKELFHQHYIEIGRKGGTKIRDLKGSSYFAMLGKRSGESKREMKRKKQLSTPQFDSKTSKSYNKINNKTSEKLAEKN